MSFYDIIADEARWLKYQIKSNHNVNQIMKNRALVASGVISSEKSYEAYKS